MTTPDSLGLLAVGGPVGKGAPAVGSAAGLLFAASQVPEIRRKLDQGDPWGALMDTGFAFGPTAWHAAPKGVSFLKNPFSQGSFLPDPLVRDGVLGTGGERFDPVRGGVNPADDAALQAYPKIATDNWFKWLANTVKRSSLERKILERQNLKDFDQNPGRLEARAWDDVRAVHAELQALDPQLNVPWHDLIKDIIIKKELSSKGSNPLAAFSLGPDHKGIIYVSLELMSLPPARRMKVMAHEVYHGAQFERLVKHFHGDRAMAAALHEHVVQSKGFYTHLYARNEVEAEYFAFSAVKRMESTQNVFGLQAVSEARAEAKNYMDTWTKTARVDLDDSNLQLIRWHLGYFDEQKREDLKGLKDIKVGTLGAEIDKLFEKP